MKPSAGTNVYPRRWLRDPQLLRGRPPRTPPFPVGHPRTRWYTHGRGALWDAARVLRLRPGDGVLAPSYNCGAEIDPFIQAGLQVSYYEGDGEWQASPDVIEASLRENTRAVMVVHFFGFPQRQTRAIKALCEARGIALIEDCAHAFLSRFADGSPAGSVGDLAVFSPRKIIASGTGAALVLNSLGFSFAGVPAMGLGAALSKKLLATKPGRPIARLLSAEEPYVSHAPAANAFIPAVHKGAPLSWLAMRHISRSDPEDVVRRRRENYELVAATLPPARSFAPALPGLPAGVSPLAFPIWAEDRRAVIGVLQRSGLRPQAWWAGFHGDVPWGELPAAAALKNHLVAVPVHQYVEPRLLREATGALRELAD
ncbi:MAG: DegT/DnrJ/EryC1/StrS family aminotransferase [Dehalococcoidia bacterium]